MTPDNHDLHERSRQVDVRPRLVLSLPPDSRRLSSNIRVSPYYRAYVNLDTERFPFAPKNDLHLPKTTTSSSGTRTYLATIYKQIP